jgi:acetyl-CoA carboxylase carboxyltransferase component
MVFAWPTAEMAVMGAEGAIGIIYRRELTEAEDAEAEREQKLKEYRELLYNPYIAASRGYVDEVIVPQQTRPKIVAALELLSTKHETRPAKKHGNIPM